MITEKYKYHEILNRTYAQKVHYIFPTIQNRIYHLSDDPLIDDSMHVYTVLFEKPTL